MTGLGGLNPSPGARVLGLVQFQVPTITQPGDLQATAEKIAAWCAAPKPPCRRSTSSSFPNTASTAWTRTAGRMLCDLDGPEIDLLRAGVGVFLPDGAQPQRRPIKQRGDRRRSRR